MNQLKSCAIVIINVLFWGYSSILNAQVMIAHDDLQINTIDRNQARLLFTMRIHQWPNNVPVRVFVLPDDHPLHRNFSKIVLGLFPYQLRGVWDRQLFSGTGQAPTTVTTEAEMLKRVASTPGAIGYIETQPKQPLKSIQTLTVQ
jgi:ABC-type phosphate transport system substrate-binding protein